MELLMWLEQVALWQLQRKEKAMPNDKIHGFPRGGYGPLDNEQVTFWTEDYERYLAHQDTHVNPVEIMRQLGNNALANEVIARHNDDARRR
jgi:hypothetical protein